ncbi:hypothetical protein DRE_07756 [Drechslerella stenobrocha 248]|uniref:Transcription factor Pcc1 n=1 Tax=Drechslerella stenobrocha 248 TaxID=1043628 RepID=W7IGZ9_9PEZI|nr:hypothetical protein DRE_07756 [Drechslerella stenobrocha 248]
MASSTFPHSLSLAVPLPTPRLAAVLARSLAVDRELSPFVHRSFAVSPSDPAVLVIDYHAATARMLRVAVNGCMESLNLVLHVCEELDQDALDGTVEPL